MDRQALELSEDRKPHVNLWYRSAQMFDVSLECPPFNLFIVMVVVSTKLPFSVVMPTSPVIQT